MRLGVTAYIPVVVECGAVSAAFLAVPDENVGIGQAKLHYKSEKINCLVAWLTSYLSCGISLLVGIACRYVVDG